MRLLFAALLLDLTGLLFAADPKPAPAECDCCKPACTCDPCKCLTVKKPADRLDIGGLFYDVQPDGSLKPCVKCNAAADAFPRKSEPCDYAALSARVKDGGTGTLFVGVPATGARGAFAAVDRLDGFAPGVYLCYCRAGTPVMCKVVEAPAPYRLAPGCPTCPTCPTCPRR